MTTDELLLKYIIYRLEGISVGDMGLEDGGDLETYKEVPDSEIGEFLCNLLEIELVVKWFYFTDSKGNECKRELVLKKFEDGSIKALQRSTIIQTKELSVLALTKEQVENPPDLEEIALAQ
jgi:hypothetical protein